MQLSSGYRRAQFAFVIDGRLADGARPAVSAPAHQGLGQSYQRSEFVSHRAFPLSWPWVRGGSAAIRASVAAAGAGILAFPPLFLYLPAA